MGSRGQSSASGTGGHSMSDSVVSWYKENFPDDTILDGEDTSISFAQALNNIKDIYDLFPYADSVARERIFLELSFRTGKSYGEIYEKWLEGA